MQNKCVHGAGDQYSTVGLCRISKTVRTTADRQIVVMTSVRVHPQRAEWTRRDPASLLPQRPAAEEPVWGHVFRRRRFCLYCRRPDPHCDVCSSLGSVSGLPQQQVNSLYPTVSTRYNVYKPVRRLGHRTVNGYQNLPFSLTYLSNLLQCLKRKLRWFGHTAHRVIALKILQGTLEGQ